MSGGQENINVLLKERQPIPLSLAILCCLSPCMMPAHVGEGSFLYPVYQFKCYNLSRTAPQTHPDVMFTSSLAILCPGKLIPKINHHGGRQGLRTNRVI